MLNRKEEELLELLWDNETPMTSKTMLDIIKLGKYKLKADVGIHRIINSLLEKNMIKICGSEKSGKLYARRFEPVLTREEYTIEVLAQKNLNPKSLTQLALGLIKMAKCGGRDDKKKDDLSDDFISKLEEMVKQMDEEEEK